MPVDLSYVSSVFVGTTNKDCLFFFHGFDFRSRKETQLGVRKEVGKKYSQKADHADQSEMHELRRSLRYEAERTLDWLENKRGKEEGIQA